MTEGSCSCLDLNNDLLGIFANSIKKDFLFQFAFGYIRQFLFPVCCQFRFLKIFWYKVQKLLCFGSQIDFIASLFHKEGVEKFFNDICSGGNCAKSTGFSQCLCCLCIF